MTFQLLLFVIQDYKTIESSGSICSGMRYFGMFPVILYTYIHSQNVMLLYLRKHLLIERSVMYK